MNSSIHYQLTEQEVVRGLLRYRRLPTRLWLRLAIGVFGLLVVIFSYQLPVGRSEGFFTAGLLFIGISIASVLLTPILLRQAVAKVVRGNQVYTDAKEVSFDEKGLVFSSTDHKAEVTWALFKKLTEDERYFYLHSDDLGNVTLLPRSAFDDASLSEFLRCSQSVPRA